MIATNHVSDGGNPYQNAVDILDEISSINITKIMR